MVHYIYKITLLCGSLKGHYYIGKHSTKDDSVPYYGSGKIVTDYYKKYGHIEGVTLHKEILEYSSSFKENMEKEKIYVGDKYLTDPLCLNLCEGGWGVTGIFVSDETKKKKSESHKGKPSPKKGKPCPSLKGHLVSDITKQKISQANSGEKNGMFGKKPWNKGRKEEKYVGGNHPNAVKVNQYTLDGDFIKTWDCINDFSNQIGKRATHISQCCKGKRLSAYGYKWTYA